MAEIDAKTVMKLRAATGAGMMDCKAALSECGGDVEKAKDWLRKKGKQIADKKADRETKAGAISSYIHGVGKIGVLLELKCESDFVAKNEDFQALGRDLCMQIAAASPARAVAVTRDQVPADLVAKEKEIAAAQVPPGKPAQVVEMIVEGKLADFFKQRVLLEQPFVKDPSITVRDRIQLAIGKMGENISVGRFVRYELGE